MYILLRDMKFLMFMVYLMFFWENEIRKILMFIFLFLFFILLKFFLLKL